MGVCGVVIIVISVMHVVGGVPLRGSLCSRVDGVCWCLAVCHAPSCYSECGVLCYL